MFYFQKSCKFQKKKYRDYLDDDDYDDGSLIVLDTVYIHHAGVTVAAIDIESYRMWYLSRRAGGRVMRQPERNCAYPAEWCRSP